MSRRARWLRRILVVLIGLAVLLFAARLAFRGSVDRRLDEEIALVRAEGAPLTLAEWASGEVPDTENAAEIYGQVFDRLATQDDVWEEDEQEGYLLLEAQEALDEAVEEGSRDLPAEHRAVLDRWIGRNEEALALLPEALARPSCDFPFDASRGVEAEFPHFEPLGEIQRLLRARAMAALRRGDVDRTVDDLALGIRVAEQTTQPLSFLALLLRGSYQEDGIRVLELALEVDAPPPAVLERLGAALASLDRDRVLPRAFVFERAFGGSAYAKALEDAGYYEEPAAHEAGDLPSRFGRRLFGDLLFRQDHARYLELVRRALALAEQPYPAVREEWETLSEEARNGPSHAVISRMLTVIWWPHVVRSRLRHEARLDLARLAVLAEQHRGRSGHLPARLEEMGPEATQRRDPFRDAPYRCRPTEGGGIVLYSVGPDGDDDGGHEGEDATREGDLVFRIPGRATER